MIEDNVNNYSFLLIIIRQRSNDMGTDVRNRVIVQGVVSRVSYSNHWLDVEGLVSCPGLVSQQRGMIDDI